MMRILLHSPDAMIEFGQKLGQILRPGSLVLLNGPLGAGKTLLTRGIALGKGLKNSDQVTSPTFTLMHQYPTDPPILHLDVYRLKSVGEFIDLGAEEFLASDSICIIEWAEKVFSVLPDDYLSIEIQIPDSNSRLLLLTAKGSHQKFLSHLT